jgi:hypothetical protein
VIKELTFDKIFYDSEFIVTTRIMKGFLVTNTAFNNSSWQ